MKILYGGIKSGKTNQLLKLFLEDKNSSTFITDELTLDEVVKKINYLQNNEIIDIIDINGKEIKTHMNVNCNSDYFNIIHEAMGSSIYLDLHMPREFRQTFKIFCLDLEKEYGLNIVMMEQTPVLADGTLKVVEYTEYNQIERM